MEFTIRQVKTKTSDGGTSSQHIDTSNMTSTDTSRSPPNRHVHDAFSYYSNDQIRMKTLTLAADRSNNTNQEEPKAQPQQHQERKTRISFELHPSLILDEWLQHEDLSFGDLDEAGTGIDDFLDLLEDNLRARASSPV